MQERGGVRHELSVGESHYTAPGVDHWHGATPDSEFTQVALGRGDAAETVWLDKVTDASTQGVSYCDRPLYSASVTGSRNLMPPPNGTTPSCSNGSFGAEPCQCSTPGGA